MRMARICTLLLIAMLLAACDATPRLPKFDFKSVRKPAVSVVGVRVTDVSSAASRVEATIEVTNPNDVPLPLTHASYTINAGGHSVHYTAMPNRTIPANGTQVFTVPAAIAGDHPSLAGASYEVTGSVTYHPPGSIRRLLTESNVPLPKASMSGAGTIE